MHSSFISAFCFSKSITFSLICMYSSFAILTSSVIVIYPKCMLSSVELLQQYSSPMAYTTPAGIYVSPGASIKLRQSSAAQLTLFINLSCHIFLYSYISFAPNVSRIYHIHFAKSLLPNNFAYSSSDVPEQIICH